MIIWTHPFDIRVDIRCCRDPYELGIGQDFVIPDHAAVARQDIRGEVRVDLIWIGVLDQVPFSTEIKAPELVPVRFADLVRDSLRHGYRCGIRDFSFPKLAISHFSKSISRHTGTKWWFRNNNSARRGRLVQGAASRWRFVMRAASIPALVPPDLTKRKNRALRPSKDHSTKENAPELDYSSFHGKTGTGRPTALWWKLSVPPECIRTPVHEERVPYRT
jgi:hypothetical protein